MRSIIALIITFLFITAIVTMSFVTTSSKKTFKNRNSYGSSLFNSLDSGDIAVGNRTTDSTGDLIISASDITQFIIPTISYLNGMNLSNPSLMVTPASAYIILNGADSNGSAVKIAIQVMSNNDSTLTYHPHGRTLLHICTKISDCASCQFITLGSLILTCECGSQAPSDTIQSPCHDDTYLLK